MPQAGLTDTLAGIEIITDRLAAHNTGEKVLSPTEERILLLEFGALNRNIEQCMKPVRKVRSSKLVKTYDHAIHMLIAAALITVSVIVMGMVLHSIFSLLVESMMRPPVLR
jgi:hypothetical protein